MSKAIINCFGARICILGAVGVLALQITVFAGLNPPREANLTQVGWAQNLGKSLPLEELFLDESGQSHRLQDYFGKKPVIFVFAYYECPNLCTLVLNGVVDALKALPQKLGRDFELLTLSIDPSERPKLALMKRRTYLAQLGKTQASSRSWRFLTAAPDHAEGIARVAHAAGFGYHYDRNSRQFAHPSGLIVLSGDGRIRQYMTGIHFDPGLLSKAIEQASRSKTGSVIEEVLLYCFHYDPTASRYGPRILELIRWLAALSVLGMVGFLARAFRAEGRGW